MAASNSVVIKQTFFVTLAEPTPARVLTLSAIDSQLLVRFTSDYLLIYNPPSGSDQSVISSSFRAALSEVLILYYPLLGRVRKRPNESGLEVDCRSQGVLFVEAVSDCYSAADFDKPPQSVAEWQGFLSFFVRDVLDGPSLVVQLTWLKDGAVAIGVGINHSICDGMGSAEFLNSFAELAAGRLGRAADMKPTPVWDRHLLTPPHPQLCHRQSPPPPPEFHRVPDLCRFMSRFTDEPLVPTAVTFEKTHLTRLKSFAQSTRYPGEEDFTSFEVLTAHIWRSWATSLKFPPNQVLKLLFSINVRKLMKPNLPVGYYGNAIVFGCAQTTAGELVEKKLDHASDLVKKAKERVTDEHVRHVTELVSESGASPDFVGALIITQWTRLGLEKVDFGMGRPVHVGPVCTDRHCFLLPVSSQNDAVKAIVAVPLSAVDKYESLLRNEAM